MKPYHNITLELGKFRSSPPLYRLTSFPQAFHRWTYVLHEWEHDEIHSYLDLNNNAPLWVWPLCIEDMTCSERTLGWGCSPGPVPMLANQTHFGTGNLSSVPSYEPEDWGTSKMGVRIRAEQYSRSKWSSLHKGTPVLRTNGYTILRIFMGYTILRTFRHWIGNINNDTCVL